jgi:hypothetical protein
MMPEVGRVLDAARHVADSYRGHDGNGPAMVLLIETLDALDAKLANVGGEPAYEEHERTWGELVAGDQILSTKTQRWYEVDRMVKDGKGNVKINIKGNAKPIVRPVGDKTMVRRGVNGDAMDILETLWSMQTRPDDIPTAGGTGPMIGEETEE